MNFFKKLMLKLERAAERKRARREGEQVAENTFRPPEPIVTTPAPFKVAPEMVNLTEDPEDPSVPPEVLGENARSYLERYPDVARHRYFGLRPARHYQFFGVKEGRLWYHLDVPLRDAGPALPILTMPSGRTFSVPFPDKENNMGYMERVAAHLNRVPEWRNVGMTWSMQADGIMSRMGIKSPDRRAWIEDARNWPVLAEEHWFPDKSKTQFDNEGWAAWAARTKEETEPVPTQQEIKL